MSLSSRTPAACRGAVSGLQSRAAITITSGTRRWIQSSQNSWKEVSPNPGNAHRAGRESTSHRGGSAWNDPTSPSYGGGAYKSGGHGGGGTRNTNAKYPTMRGSKEQYENHTILQDVNWEKQTLKEFEKDLYKEHEEVTSRTPAENQKLVAELGATLRGRGNVPGPITSFEHMRPTFGDTLMQELTNASFSTPSPIQKFAWPILSKGRDSVGIAQTGSGKTLAYLLPALSHITQQPDLQPGDGPIALVMGPTRELVQQIEAEAKKFGDLTGIKSAVAYGGSGTRHSQARACRDGAHILIATPGRLIDFMAGGVVNLKRVTYLVLDEADRMLDMGFEPSIRKIVKQTRPDRQTVLFSATWPKEIQSMARDFCKEDPTMCTIGSTELQCNPDVTQIVEVIPELQRQDHLLGIFEKLKDSPDADAKVLIFTGTKRTADQMERNLRGARIPCAAIHGDKDQPSRERMLRDYKNGTFKVLIATDVAQRGLDIPHVKYVVNYDLPNTIHDYVHRIGRTGRAGVKGTAVSYFCWDHYDPGKLKLAQELCDAMRDVKQEPPAALQEIASGRSSTNRYGGNDRNQGSYL